MYVVTSLFAELTIWMGGIVMTDLAKRAEQVADELRGTCKHLNDVATDEELDSQEFCLELDDRVFLCECCEWWFELSELSESSIENETHKLVCDQCEPGDDA